VCVFSAGGVGGGGSTCAVGVGERGAEEPGMGELSAGEQGAGELNAGELGAGELSTGEIENYVSTCWSDREENPDQPPG
jgi:hypothetical protein